MDDAINRAHTMMQRLGLCVSFSLLTGCVQLVASAAADAIRAGRPTYAQLEARLPAPSPAGGQVVVYYPEAGMGQNVLRRIGSVGFSIGDNTYVVAEKSFLIIDVPPGRHTLGPATPRTISEELSYAASVDSLVDFDVSPGRRSFFEIHASTKRSEVAQVALGPGGGANIELRPVASDVAELAVRDTHAMPELIDRLD